MKLATMLSDLAVFCAVLGFGAFIEQPFLGAAFAFGMLYRGLRPFPSQPIGEVELP